MAGVMPSTCCRDASSGTTPPKRRCSSSCEKTTLLRMKRPSSTTAAAVSSQLVSMPRMVTISDRILPGQAGGQRPRRRRVSLAERGAPQLLAGHDHGVLVVVGVVARPDSALAKPELLVQRAGDLVADPDLERDPPGAETHGDAKEAEHQQLAQSAAAEGGPDGDGGDVRLVDHQPQPTVADHRRPAFVLAGAVGPRQGEQGKRKRTPDRRGWRERRPT